MNDDRLDDLFKTTFSKKGEYLDDKWDEFELRLNKKMFYKFSLHRFNIYYLSLILTSSLGSLVALSLYIGSLKSNVQNNSPSFNADTLIIADTIVTINNENGRQQVVKKFSIEKHTLAPATNTQEFLARDSAAVAPANSSKVSVNDSIPSFKIQEEIPVTTHEPAKAVVLKKKKIIYVVPQRDTIVTTDTVVGKKKMTK